MSRNVDLGLCFLVALTLVLCANQPATAQATIFADGFESGDTSAWSVTVGLALPIYVSFTTGTNVAGCGLDSMSPCQTVGFGLGEAGATGRSHVWVAEGTYHEQVVLFDGLKLLGGFDVVDWTRNPAVNLSIIEGDDDLWHPKAIIARDITSHTTLFEGFVVLGEDGSSWSATSTAIYIVDCGSNLIVRDNVIIAGDGDYGEDGFWGMAGSPGADGANGSSAVEPGGAFNCFAECVSGGGGTSGGAGGQTNCGGTQTDGGDGGAADCPDFDEDTDLCDACPGLAPRQTVTTSGSTGTGPGGSGGLGGCDGLIDDSCTGLGCGCVQPPTDWCPQGMAGAAGAPGPNGADGPHGPGASDPLGTVFDHEWGGQAGMNGGSGQAGRGGGGGGAGGGVETYFNAACTSAEYSDLGGSGGGGGAGGCPGDGGGGGAAGGGSFGIFVSFTADPEGDVPTISNNAITRGNGSWAGNGVPGMPTGSGGQGGLGGAGGSTPDIWCAAAGGNGGPGGAAGIGGDGGGGAGGISCGICAYGYGSSDLSGWMVGTTITGGSGGAGGGSLGNGGTGVVGALVETNFPINDEFSAR